MARGCGRFVSVNAVAPLSFFLCGNLFVCLFVYERYSRTKWLRTQAAEPYMRGAAKAEIARTGKVSRTPPRPAAETPNDPYN